MPALNQEVLKRAGLREQYLKGETTLAKAKASLRGQAVTLGIAKPQKPTAVGYTKTQLAKAVAINIIQKTQAVNPYKTDPVSIVARIEKTEQLGILKPAMVSWTYQQISNAATDENYRILDTNGRYYNPFWYHAD